MGTFFTSNFCKKQRVILSESKNDVLTIIEKPVKIRYNKNYFKAAEVLSTKISVCGVMIFVLKGIKFMMTITSANID